MDEEQDATVPSREIAAQLANANRRVALTAHDVRMIVREEIERAAVQNISIRQTFIGGPAGSTTSSPPIGDSIGGEWEPVKT